MIKAISSIGLTTALFFFVALGVVLFAAWDSVVMVSQVLVWAAIPVALFAMAKHFVIGFNQMRSSKAEASTAVTEAKAATFQLETQQAFAQAALAQMQAGLIHIETIDTPKFKAFPAATTERIAGSSTQTADVPLLPALEKCDNILVVGGKGTGKTTLMQWIEQQRAARAKTIVLDSHARPSQWQGHIVGIGRQYEAIKGAMVRLTNTLKSRYDSPEYAKGEDAFETIDTFIDEFTLLPKALKDIGYNVQSYSIPALTEGRKVNINCVWGIHSDKVTAMGLEGASDIKECFDAIVYLKNVQGERYAICDFGEGKQKDVRYIHPGPFQRSQNIHQIAASTDVIEVQKPSILGASVAQFTAPEMALIEAWKDKPGNKSNAYRALYRARNGQEFTGKCNTTMLNEVESILNKAGLL